MKNKMMKVKVIALAHLLAATCMGWSCMGDVRDAAWGGVLDYVTGTTAVALNCAFTADGCFAD